MESVSVVIPCFNSEGKLSEISKEISSVIASYTYEIIFVDDGSSDSTWEEIKQLCCTSLHIKGIRFAANMGQQSAVFAGLCFCSGDMVITMDDDFQHNPDDIPAMISKSNEGYDLVYTVNKKEYSFIRKAGSFLHDIFFYAAFRKPLRLKITSFRIIRKQLIKKIIRSEKSFIYISAIALRFKPSSAFITGGNVSVKESRYSKRKLFKLFFSLIIYYSFPDFIYKAACKIINRDCIPAKKIIMETIDETAGNISL